jgi:hypothetical protein
MRPINLITIVVALAKVYHSGATIKQFQTIIWGVAISRIICKNGNFPRNLRETDGLASGLLRGLISQIHHETAESL